jgi:hypothetical protein
LTDLDDISIVFYRVGRRYTQLFVGIFVGISSVAGSIATFGFGSQKGQGIVSMIAFGMLAVIAALGLRVGVAINAASKRLEIPSLRMFSRWSLASLLVLLPSFALVAVEIPFLDPPLELGVLGLLFVGRAGLLAATIAPGLIVAFVLTLKARLHVQVFLDDEKPEQLRESGRNGERSLAGASVISTIIALLMLVGFVIPGNSVFQIYVALAMIALTIPTIVLSSQSAFFFSKAFKSLYTLQKLGNG